MGDFRIPYGFALGKENNFFANTAGTFISGDTTPDVSNGTLFYTINTSITTITNFDLTDAGGVGSVGHFEGKLIEVVYLDDSTSLLNSSSAGGLILTQSDGVMGLYSSNRFLYHNSAWIELNRNYARSVITVESKNLTSVASSTGGVFVRGVSIVNGYAATGSPLVIRKAIGGAQGQLLTIAAAGPSSILVIVNSAAADTFVSVTSASATQFRMASSGNVTFVRVGGTWNEIVPIWINSSANVGL